MPIRRNTDPINVKHIWNAIKAANHSRSTADVAKITKFFQNIDDYTVTQVELYVKQAVKDKLIIPIKKNDSGNQTYKVPTQEVTELDGKDWYCFECHLAGDVTPCKKCFRVFHQDCIGGARKKFDGQKNATKACTQSIPKPATVTEPNSEAVTIICDDDEATEETNGTENFASTSSNQHIDRSGIVFDEDLCAICNIQSIDNSCEMDKSEINYLLKFVLHRIRAWLPNTITHTMAAEERPEWLTDAELTWRANHLFFEHRDMSVIGVKLNTETYIMFSEFLEDVYNVQHNVAIFHGIESQEFGAAELMVRDTLHDITEMKHCVDCYKHSNEKINSKWFCLPCRQPHQLVWAKQKGYPYWPAKVMNETDTHFDVRFFGGKYERSLLMKNFVKPITMSKESLQIRPSAAFNKAYEELQYYRKLLADPLELELLRAESKQKRKTPSKHKSSSMNTSKKSTPKNAKTPKTPKGKKSKATPTSKSSNKSVRESSSAKKTAVTPSLKRKSTNCIAINDAVEKRKKPIETEAANSTISGNVIDISDVEEDEECHEYSFRENSAAESFHIDDSYEQVTSSTETFGKLLSPRSESGMQPLDQPYSDSVEKMRRKLECLPNKKDIIKCAMDCMQIEIDRITNDHNEHLKRLFESHNQQISETKKKQWCYNCEQDAIYHCCWNTAYCSQTCQQQHWQAEHKKVCRRKR
ncbi:hypothetical protein JTB14_037623 [Gonioctena quinquepunctata]|nr:hypothetical protein JTB14_037623 [Gonioctena quinquepunctata]